LKILLNSTGKKYYREWIFRKATISFLPGQKSVLLGPNGSGKSTLLQVIAGAIMPNEGSIVFEQGGKSISPDEIFSYISLSAPYLELVEEFTLQEIVRFHFKFKSPANGLSEKEIIEMTGLSEKAGQSFKFFSSGMKQRVKLALALFSDTPVLLLDEPCSNLDSSGIQWYKQNIDRFTKDRTVIVASNQNKDEYYFCDAEVNIDDYKP
jgi:ABC-type multidrug transport system ATPase subunit